MTHVIPTPTGRPSATRGRLRRLNLVSQVVAVIPVGVLLIVIDTDTWWEGLVLAAGSGAALLAVVRWSMDDIFGVAYPCLFVTAAVWPFGVLVSDSYTAFYGLSIVGPIVVPYLARYRVPAAVALVTYVAAVGSLRFLVADAEPRRTLIGFVLIPTAVQILTTSLMFVSKVFYDLFAELEEAREREPELAVARERIRFASDLHDIQGHTLHVVKLKTALAQKLVHADPARAEEELREIYTLVGDTIAQTKELAHAQRRLNLTAELENAKNLFEAAGIHVRVTRESEVDAQAGELLGQVLRETTTNILRHAEAGDVRITLSHAGITIVNDGAQKTTPELRGLATLRDRVVDSGGVLTVEQEDGRFTTAATFAREAR